MNKKFVIVLAFFLFSFLILTLEVSAASDPSDIYYKNQWYLNRIRFNYIQDIDFVGKDVVVAVIDSGVDIQNPDLKDKIWNNKFEIDKNGIDDDNNGFIDDINGWDFVNNIPDPSPKISPISTEDGLNHGTIIAGIIGAKTNNKIGISGISKNTKIMPLRALNEGGEGKVNDVIRALDYAVNNGANIINLSFSGLNYNQGFKEAIERAYRSGVIVVAAAGNNSKDLDKNPLYPACFSGLNNENIIITVSSTDTLDQKTSFSSYGQNCVDISAPGISFYSTYFYDLEKKENKNYNGYWSGTSMSSAIISGSLALIKEANPKLNNSKLLEVLFKSSDNINNLNPEYVNKLGSGRINLSNSINWALEKWSNLDGRFLLFPQSNIKDFKNEYKDFNTIRIIKKREAGEDSRFLPYDEGYNGSINMTTGDINNDGVNEIIIGAGIGGGPHVKIFDISGNLKNQFFAYDSKFRGGVNVAVGDLDGDGNSEIITGAGVGGGPHVKIFDSQGNLKGQFFAYENNFFGGIKVKVGNIYGKDTRDNKEIIVSPGIGREPEVKIFSSSGSKLRSILSYSSNFKNGVNLSIGDLNKDGIDEIITGAGPGGAPHVRAFTGKGELVESFYGLENNFIGGVVVDFIEINN